MARIQTLPLPNGTFAVVIDGAETLTEQELDDVGEVGTVLRSRLGAVQLLVFTSTVDVVR